jgi:hypothetical protein
MKDKKCIIVVYSCPKNTYTLIIISLKIHINEKKKMWEGKCFWHIAKTLEIMKKSGAVTRPGEKYQFLGLHTKHSFCTGTPCRGQGTGPKGRLSGRTEGCSRAPLP